MEPLKDYQKLSGGSRADIDHWISKHYTNSVKWLQQQVAEYFRCNIAEQEVRQIRANAQSRDLRNDGLDASLGRYENWL